MAQSKYRRLCPVDPVSHPTFPRCRVKLPWRWFPLARGLCAVSTSACQPCRMHLRKKRKNPWCSAKKMKSDVLKCCLWRFFIINFSDSDSMIQVDWLFTLWLWFSFPLWPQVIPIPWRGSWTMLDLGSSTGPRKASFFAPFSSGNCTKSDGLRGRGIQQHGRAPVSLWR